MKLIAVISHKGGAGKTTSAVQLAEELARRGQRTLLVDADRQQGAGLLLGIDSPAGCVQRTTEPGLDYLGSARLTDLEVADCYASVVDRFDVGVVDTPSLDDALARAWLREAAATLMVLQVDPLTVKTLPSALNTLEVVRAFKPSIQLLGLLPTMFNQDENAHRSLLAELLSRRPEAVFTPVVPADPGLMHRANAEGRPPVGEAARQAYECAVDRILRALDSAGSPGCLPQGGRMAPPRAPAARPTPAWQQQPVAADRPARPQDGAAAGPAGPADGGQPTPVAPPPGRTANPVPAAAPWSASAGGADSRPPAAGRFQESEPALETLTTPAPGAPAGSSALASRGNRQPPPGVPERPVRGTTSDGPAGTLDSPPAADDSVEPDWWRQPDARVDSGGVARHPEPWLVRARFAIACTVACLALAAAVVMGSLRRVQPAGHLPAGPPIPAADAAARPNASDDEDPKSAKAPSTHKQPKKAHPGGSHAERSGSRVPAGRGGSKP